MPVWVPLPLRPSPGLQGLTAEQRALFEWLTAQCAWEAQQDRAERLAVGEPFEVPRWYFGGRSIPRQDGWPAWLRDHFGGVHADDTIDVD